MPGLIEQLNPNNQPAALVSRWLSYCDTLGDTVPLQNLSAKKTGDIVHPLQSSHTIFDRQTNAQLGVIIEELLTDPRHFEKNQTDKLLSGLEKETYLSDTHNDVSPLTAINILADKQEGYLKKGESWQFAKVGLEVNPAAQKIAFKLHALQELLEPFSTGDAREYEDKLADILTKHILDNATQFGAIASLIGPSRFSVRWIDFLEGGENPKQHAWIKDVLESKFLSQKKQMIPEILLNIAFAESKITPGTIIQLLEKKTFRSTEKVPPLKAGDVADPHKHTNKTELYLPLMGAGSLKVQFNGTGPIHTFAPNPNVIANLDLTKIGAKTGGDKVPTLVYDGKEYRPETPDGNIINMSLEDGGVAQFIVVKPGDIHDFVNTGISPASVYALTLGFAQDTTKSIDGDFITHQFNKNASF